jgi:RNA polymerase sigma-70 factor (ECF subfamily)
MTFQELLERIRQGDSEAYEVMIREFGPRITREARVRLQNSPARDLCDSQDVVQSVWRSFYRRMTDGQFRVEKPEQLVALLVAMTRNKAIDQFRRSLLTPRKAATTSSRAARLVHDPNAATPDDQLAARELLDYYVERLSPENRAILERRVNGEAWGEIAASLGKKPDTVRKQFQRALQVIDKARGKS